MFRFLRRVKNLQQCANEYAPQVDPVAIAQGQRDFYKACLFDAWKALSQQQKGMRRMARRIKRLQSRVKELEMTSTNIDESKTR